jgi:hypothetical protein
MNGECARGMAGNNSGTVGQLILLRAEYWAVIDLGGQ